eukprot:366215-Chlamydomonas_euryale.AAC.2
MPHAAVCPVSGMDTPHRYRWCVAHVRPAVDVHHRGCCRRPSPGLLTMPIAQRRWDACLFMHGEALAWRQPLHAGLSPTQHTVWMRCLPRCLPPIQRLGV